MSYIPLIAAWLCIDCLAISTEHKECPCCTSKVLYPLSGFFQVLNREPEVREEVNRG